MFHLVIMLVMILRLFDNLLCIAVIFIIHTLHTTRSILLGRSHDQRKGLPEGLDLHTEKFGLPTIKDCSAGELVSPAKSYKQVKLESKEGLELYKKSHSAYTVGRFMF